MWYTDSHIFLLLSLPLSLPPLPISPCSHAPFCWTSGGCYRGTEYEPSTGLWGEWVHRRVPFGLRRRPWHQESCPHDKGMSFTSSEKENTHWNTLKWFECSARVRQKWMCLEMLTKTKCSNLFLPSSIYLKHLNGYFVKEHIWIVYFLVLLNSQSMSLY